MICPLKYNQISLTGNPNNTCVCEEQHCAWWVEHVGCAVLIGAVKLVKGKPELVK